MLRIDFMLKHLQGKVMDIGCAGEDGKGLMHSKLMASGCDIYGLDLKPLKVPLCVIGDCQALPFRGECFNTVIMGQVIEHIAAPFVALREARRVLYPGGILIITAPNAYSWDKILGYVIKNHEQEQTIVHKWLFTPAMLERMVRSVVFGVEELRIIKPGHRLGQQIALCAVKI